MKKKTTILLVLFISIQSITSAGYFGKNCDKAKKECLEENVSCCQKDKSGDEAGFTLDPLHFFLFSF